MRCATRSYRCDSEMPPGIFVSTSKFLNNTSGAVSVCAHEYLRTLGAAGFGLETVAFEVDRRPHVRLQRKLWPRPYTNQIPPYVASDVAAVVRDTGARHVFLFDAAPLAAPLRAQVGAGVRIVMLSIGLESVDHLHKLRAREEVAEVCKLPRVSRATLARKLCAEHFQRQYIDHVFCLSPFEVEIERWLGARAATWLPRTIPGTALSWRPHPNRIGFVGSINHEPNIEGLLQFAKALERPAPEGLSLRIVGAPEKIGRALAQRFRFIEYLGPLPDAELEVEAGTWSCFVHPLFCWACGCSIKLAVALGWQIPVLTTPAGCRGYTWSAGELPLAETPEELARLAIVMLNPETAAAARREVQQVVRSSPSLDQVAAVIRRALFAGPSGTNALQPACGVAGPAADGVPEHN